MKINKTRYWRICALFIVFLFVFLFSRGAFCQIPIPKGITINVGDATNPADVSTALQILALITVLSLAPAILVMMTAFTRIIIVLGFLRQALATQQMPPNQVLIGLALFLTFFAMAPVGQAIYTKAYSPYRAGELTQAEAIKEAFIPIRDFMARQTREKDLGLFVGISKINEPKSWDDVPWYVVIPAFITSELKTAFTIGFIIYIPFLIIDMVVASTLMSMGMLMLPPIFISLPFKIIMFVLADGWNLLIGSLMQSF